MIPIDMNELDSPGGGSDWWYKGKRFSGIIYEKDSKTGVIVQIAGFDGGFLWGPDRTWSPSGVLLEETFYRYGGFHGPRREWHPDGTLKLNEYRNRGKLSLPEGPAEPVIDIDLDAMEFVEQPWGWGREPTPPPSFDEFRGSKLSEGDKEWYVIEQANNNRQVVRVESLEVVERKLLITYTRRSLRFSDEFATRLIQAKILGDVCMDSYRGRVDQIAFQSVPTKQVLEARY
jgi:hypothetical protein